MQTIIYNKDQVPPALGYINEQIKVLKYFVKIMKNQLIGIDRTLIRKFLSDAVQCKNMYIIFRKISNEHLVVLGSGLPHIRHIKHSWSILPQS